MLLVQNFSNLSHTWDMKLKLYVGVCQTINISSTPAPAIVKKERSLSFRSRDMHAD